MAEPYDLTMFRPTAEKELAGWKSGALSAAQGNLAREQAQMAEIDPYYSGLQKQLMGNQEKAQSSLTASMIRRGAGRSGVMTKAESSLARTYAGLGENIEGERRKKSGEIGTNIKQRETELGGVETDYQSRVDTLARELYSNWKTEQDALREAELNRQAQLAAAQAAATASAPTAAATPAQLSPSQLAKQMASEGYGWGDVADTLDATYGPNTAKINDKLLWDLFAKGTGNDRVVDTGKASMVTRY